MKRRFLLFALINTFLIIICFTCKYSTDSNSTENKMYVYSNSGYTFYLVDYKTFKVIKEIHLPTSNSVSYGGMMITTNRDYLFFAARRSFPDSPWGFAVYNIANEKLDNLFFIELNYGISYFISAENKSEPGLIYVHSRDFGTYLIDLFEQKVVELISDEHYFHLDKRIYHSP